ncbi:uncharacterized protein LOC128831105 isoform X1 [Malaclemys terrapin pileata]|uniref:uncharacterized protein LOC128831105 isoform X1 n=1 Tax=Malaclemys terrapin pileata TaxID=2991368 RepID=UPI0023A8E4B6|nr:uncharacterized protein LOC128831105 isoform X1 [Malaclemys terrapin pileata]
MLVYFVFRSEVCLGVGAGHANSGFVLQGSQLLPLKESRRHPPPLEVFLVSSDQYQRFQRKDARNAKETLANKNSPCLGPLTSTVCCTLNSVHTLQQKAGPTNLMGCPKRKHFCDEFMVEVLEKAKRSFVEIRNNEESGGTLKTNRLIWASLRNLGNDVLKQTNGPSNPIFFLHQWSVLGTSIGRLKSPFTHLAMLIQRLQWCVPESVERTPL